MIRFLSFSAMSLLRCRPRFLCRPRPAMTDPAVGLASEAVVVDHRIVGETKKDAAGNLAPAQADVGWFRTEPASRKGSRASLSVVDNNRAGSPAHGQAQVAQDGGAGGRYEKAGLALAGSQLLVASASG